MLTPPDQVFISYSRADKDFLDQLLLHLKPLGRTGRLQAWSDKEIRPGTDWLEQINKAVASTKVAVMLVSPGFLASDFIREFELMPLLQRARSGVTQILWVLVKACLYQESPLNDYQALVSPPAKPLAEMEAERDSAWVDVCKGIIAALNVQKFSAGEDLRMIRPAAPTRSDNSWNRSPLLFSLETSPLHIRSEGMTELVGDIFMRCICRDAVPPEHRWFSARIQFGTNVSSRLFPGPDGLAIGEPILFELGNQSRGDIVRPRIESYVAIFDRVDLVGINPGEERIFQVGNLRCNASALGGGGLAGTTEVLVRVVVGGDLMPLQTVATIESGLNIQVCPVNGSGGGKHFTTSQSVSLPISKIASLRFCERFPFAFKSLRSLKEPVLSEGFRVYSGESYPARQVLQTPDRQFRSLHLADSGTQLAASFNNVPEGIRLYVTNAELPSSTIAARLVESQSTGKGEIALVENFELRELEILAGSARAVWEIEFSVGTRSPGGCAEFGVFASYDASPERGLPLLGTATVNGSFWPCPPIRFSAAAGAVANSILPIPRFADCSSATNIMSVVP